MGLLPPAWMSKNRRRACKAVEAIDDLELLEEIARTAQSKEARLLAVEKIDDQQVLCRLATDVLPDYVCAAATSKVEDVGVLRCIARYNGGFEHGKVARQKLAAMEMASLDEVDDDDQEQLARIAMNSVYLEVKTAAAARITDPDVAIQCALTQASYSAPWSDILRCVTDTDALERIATSAQSGDACKAAMARLDDATLTKILLEGSTMSGTVAYFIRDEQLLLKLAEEQDNTAFRRGVANRLHGYLCYRCGAVNVPDEDGVLSCVCRQCGDENHDYERVDNSKDYWDDKGGQWYTVYDYYDRCTRCGHVKDYYHFDPMEDLGGCARGGQRLVRRGDATLRLRAD